MSGSLAKQLSDFLRRQRGDRTLVQFARKLGTSHSTLFRLEHGEQSITLDKLDQILGRMGCHLSDIFDVDGSGRRRM